MGERKNRFGLALILLLILVFGTSSVLSQAVCTTWTGLICVRYSCTPTEALTHNDTCFPVATTSPTIATRAPTLRPTTLRPTRPTTQAPSSIPSVAPSHGPSSSPLTLVFDPTHAPLPPLEECHEFNGIILCCASVATCLMSAGLCACCSCCGTAAACTPCVVVGKAAPLLGASSHAYGLAGEACCACCMPLLAGRVNDEESDEENDKLVVSADEAEEKSEEPPLRRGPRTTQKKHREFSYCFFLFCCFIPLRRLRWRREGAEVSPNLEECRVRWKRKIFETVNLITTILFVVSLWAIVLHSQGTAISIANEFSTSDLARGVGTSSCGLDPYETLNRTINNAEDLVNSFRLAQLSTMFLIIRFGSRCLMAFINTCRLRSSFPSCSCPTMFLYFKIYVVGMLYSGYDPWAAAMMIWRQVPETTMESYDGQVPDRKRARREAVTLFLLLLFDKLPFIAIEYYLAIQSGDVFTIAAFVDLALNLISVVTQFNEFLTVLEIPADIVFAQREY